MSDKQTHETADFPAVKPRTPMVSGVAAVVDVFNTTATNRERSGLRKAETFRAGADAAASIRVKPGETKAEKCFSP